MLLGPASSESVVRSARRTLTPGILRGRSPVFVGPVGYYCWLCVRVCVFVSGALDHRRRRRDRRSGDVVAVLLSTVYYLLVNSG